MRLWIRISWSLAVILIFSLNVNAVEITEVEINPAGSDNGNEWIEFFSNSNVNLSDYKIVNNDGDEIIVNKEFEGYFVYQLETQWLDNSDERIFIYKDDNKIFETGILDDSSNDAKTWSLCDSWTFGDNTKGEENNCEDNDEEIPEEDNEKNNSEDEINDEEVLDEEDDESDYNYFDEGRIGEEYENGNIGEISNVNDRENVSENDVIYLTPQNIKSPSNSKTVFESENEKIKKYAVYAFALFCILSIIFLIRDFYKNG